MRRRLLALTALLLLVSATTAAAQQTGRWVPLFDGRSMDGWTKMHAGDWTVRDGVLAYTGGGNGWLRTNREYGDFSLVAIWRFPSGDRWDSGLFVRAGLEGNPWPSQGYQVQMLRGREGEISGTRGSRPRPDLVKPSGEWNTFQLSLIGDRASLAINGQQATEATGLTRPRGYIGWQAEGYPLEVSYIYIWEFPAGRPPTTALPPPPRPWCVAWAETLWSLFIR